MAGLHEIMENKGACPCLVSADETLANELNSFYAHFKASNANAGHANSGLPVRQLSTPVFSEHDIRREMKRVNARKASGQDRISG